MPEASSQEYGAGSGPALLALHRDGTPCLAAGAPAVPLEQMDTWPMGNQGLTVHLGSAFPALLRDLVVLEVKKYCKSLPQSERFL